MRAKAIRRSASSWLERLWYVPIDVHSGVRRWWKGRRSDLRWVSWRTRRTNPPKWWFESGRSDWLASGLPGVSASGLEACVVRYLRSGHMFDGVMTDGEFAWKEWFAERPTGDLGKVAGVIGEWLSDCRVPDICYLEYESWAPHTWWIDGWFSRESDVFPVLAELRSARDVVDRWQAVSGGQRSGHHSFLLPGMILYPSPDYVPLIDEYLSRENATAGMHLYWRAILEAVGVIGDVSLARWIEVVVTEVEREHAGVEHRVHVVAGWACKQLPGDEASAMYMGLRDRVDCDLDALVEAFDVRRASFLEQFDPSELPRIV